MRKVKKEAYLSITRSSNEKIVIEIKDEKRNREIIELDLADFTKVITGMVMKVEVEKKGE